MLVPHNTHKFVIRFGIPERTVFFGTRMMSLKFEGSRPGKPGLRDGIFGSNGVYRQDVVLVVHFYTRKLHARHGTALPPLLERTTWHVRPGLRAAVVVLPRQHGRWPVAVVRGARQTYPYEAEYASSMFLYAHKVKQIASQQTPVDMRFSHSLDRPPFELIHG